MGSFISNSDKINNDDLKPEKARGGFLYQKQNNYSVFYYTFNQCQKQMVNGNIEIKQDTLIITYMTRGIKGDRDYFIKYNYHFTLTTSSRATCVFICFCLTDCLYSSYYLLISLSYNNAS